MKHTDIEMVDALEANGSRVPGSSSVNVSDILRQLPYMLKAMRVTQWSKNGLVLLALIFAGRMTDVRSLERTLLGFLAFSLAASVIYIVNDISDREKDRLHPLKQNRAIASGKLSIPLAIVTVALCALGMVAIIATLFVIPMANANDAYADFGGGMVIFTGVVVGYIVLNVAYTLHLKHQVLWDVFTIAAGFVMRAFAGALVIPVPISPWFYLCTLFLALFLALGKRRAEIVGLAGEAASHRAILQQYNLALLDQLMSIVVTCSLISYCLYTFLGTRDLALMATIPFVIFGMFRYLYLIYVKSEGDRPDELLWNDRQIMFAVLGCVLVAMMVLYVIPWYHHHG